MPRERKPKRDQDNSWKLERPCVKKLDAVLGKPFPVLDHGFVRVIDYLGGDNSIVQAARVSYGRGLKTKAEDIRLIRYLMQNYHTSPFEMAEIKLHIKAPIFVARQWMRHRTASINEQSGRYSVLAREFYIPKPRDVQLQSQANRQGREGCLDHESSKQVVDVLRSDANRNYEHYIWMLNLQGTPSGVSRELARTNLTLNTYTQFYWKIDLHNLMRFLALRGDHRAQVEIRAYAAVIQRILSLWVPHSHDAFLEFELESAKLCRSELAAVKALIKGRSSSSSLRHLDLRQRQRLIRLFDIGKLKESR